MQFNLSVKFVKGCHNYAANALSRMFEDMTAEQKLEFAQECNSKEECIVAVDYDVKSSQKIDDTTQTLEYGSGEPFESADLVCYRVFDDVSDVNGRSWCFAEQDNVSEMESRTAVSLDTLFDGNTVALPDSLKEREITSEECLDNQLSNEIFQVTEDIQLPPGMPESTRSQLSEVHTNNIQNEFITNPVTDPITETSNHADDTNETNAEYITPDTADDNGNVPVQDNANLIIDLVDLPTIQYNTIQYANL